MCVRTCRLREEAAGQEAINIKNLLHISPLFLHQFEKSHFGLVGLIRNHLQTTAYLTDAVMVADSGIEFLFKRLLL